MNSLSMISSAAKSHGCRCQAQGWVHSIAVFRWKSKILILTALGIIFWLFCLIFSIIFIIFFMLGFGTGKSQHYKALIRLKHIIAVLPVHALIQSSNKDFLFALGMQHTITDSGFNVF